jgi:hypothetical protein
VTDRVITSVASRRIVAVVVPGGRRIGTRDPAIVLFSEWARTDLDIEGTS